jgi:L-ascorbate metabolism protein UlaG (beta-lactamase superfamily)
MDRKEAAQLATALDPDRVCQTHYNTFHRIETNAEAFAEDLTSSEVAVVLETPQQQIDSK